jgi:hypothetical protein
MYLSTCPAAQISTMTLDRVSAKKEQLNVVDDI